MTWLNFSRIKQMDALVPISNTAMIPDSNNILALHSIPQEVSLSELPEPDDEEIQKMILNDGELALKTRLWTNLNQDWII